MNFYINKKRTISVAFAYKGNDKSVIPGVKIYNTNKNYCFSLVHNHLSFDSLIFDLTFFMKNKVLFIFKEK